ncbi:hypothetical protein BDN72DRAFT_861417 [Pluteus cervinus]|uniref:Uncharacterized protein n=1 Tax=Pluteus cervinus TaxID=181527 RepID=A0ACD3AGE8_9AGAR|nr:hypothetical protein BDN72DRAFT_861417 [Pluteus cervinus]
MRERGRFSKRIVWIAACGYLDREIDTSSFKPKAFTIHLPLDSAPQSLSVKILMEDREVSTTKILQRDIASSHTPGRLDNRMSPVYGSKKDKKRVRFHPSVLLTATDRDDGATGSQRDALAAVAHDTANQDVLAYGSKKANKGARVESKTAPNDDDDDELVVLPPEDDGDELGALPKVRLVGGARPLRPVSAADLPYIICLRIENGCEPYDSRLAPLIPMPPKSAPRQPKLRHQKGVYQTEPGPFRLPSTSALLSSSLSTPSASCLTRPSSTLTAPLSSNQSTKRKRSVGSSSQKQKNKPSRTQSVPSLAHPPLAKKAKIVTTLEKYFPRKRKEGN